MIILNDTIKILIDEKRYRTKYRAFCDNCGSDRGYLDKQNATKNRFCRKCCTRITESSKAKMSAAKRGRAPWNKGLVENRPEVKQKLSNAKKGRPSNTKGKKMSFEQKVKLSCSIRGIPIEDFDELKTPENQLERNKFADLKLHTQRFELDSYRCVSCKLDKTTLNAHHLDSWKFFPEQRFDINNLVSLCYYCHKNFHSLHGNGKNTPNTRQQFEEFMLNRSRSGVKKDVYIIAGASGAGKSWVCSHFINDPDIEYVAYDKIKRNEARSIVYNSERQTILFDPTVHVSSFIKRNSDIFNINLVVIQEDESVVAERLTGRGGTLTDSVKRRINRMKNLAKQSIFTGTSGQVLDFLKQRLSAKVSIA
jgi:hypothetical protein